MTVTHHLTLDELQQRIKQEKDPISQLRFLAVYHQVLSADPATVRKHTLFHWWPG